jgi:hypothetical protein
MNSGPKWALNIDFTRLHGPLHIPCEFCETAINVMKHLMFKVAIVCVLLFSLFRRAYSQGIQTSPYSSPSSLRGLSGQGLDIAPSNPLSLPGSFGANNEPQSLYVSESILRGLMPLVPNLQFGYLYDFGNNRVNSGRLTADYLLPLPLSSKSTVFGGAHSEFQNFWNTLKSTFSGSEITIDPPITTTTPTWHIRTV